MASVRTALEMSRLRRENTSLRQCLVLDRLTRPEAFEHFATDSPKMRQIFLYLEAVSASSEPILIYGETAWAERASAGRAQADRPRKPFVAVNVAGLDDRSQHTPVRPPQGSFTGRRRPQGCEQAADGVSSSTRSATWANRRRSTAAPAAERITCTWAAVPSRPRRGSWWPPIATWRP